MSRAAHDCAVVTSSVPGIGWASRDCADQLPAAVCSLADPAPVVTLRGDAVIYLAPDEPFVDPGAFLSASYQAEVDTARGELLTPGSLSSGGKCVPAGRAVFAHAAVVQRRLRPDLTPPMTLSSTVAPPLRLP